jgi:hypothetical protein
VARISGYCTVELPFQTESQRIAALRQSLRRAPDLR